jgi:hypothetical protein
MSGSDLSRSQLGARRAGPQIGRSIQNREAGELTWFLLMPAAGSNGWPSGISVCERKHPLQRKKQTSYQAPSQ